MKSLYFLHTNADYLVGLRLPMLVALVRAGYRVTAFAPNVAASHRERLNAFGIRGEQYAVDPTGSSIRSDALTLISLYRMFKRDRPEFVFANNIKPVVFGTIAAALAGVPNRPVLVGGLGYAFTSGGGLKDRIKRLVTRAIASALYAVAFRVATAVIFHNGDDLSLMKRWMICPRNKGAVVPGSGVDLEEFPVQRHVQPMAFAFVGRLLRDKGVYEFMSAAAEVKSKHPLATFRLIGGLDSNPAAIDRSHVDASVAAGVIEWTGHVSDVRPYLDGCSILVLPSYREGLPRSVLEGMALGKAIITTDVPGCRETVVNQRNGFLVPARSAEALAGAMSRFCEDVELAEMLGAQSRMIVEERFSVSRVNELILRIIERV